MSRIPDLEGTDLNPSARIAAWRRQVRSGDTGRHAGWDAHEPSEPARGKQRHESAVMLIARVVHAPGGGRVCVYVDDLLLAVLNAGGSGEAWVQVSPLVALASDTDEPRPLLPRTPPLGGTRYRAVACVVVDACQPRVDLDTDCVLSAASHDFQV